MVDICYTQARVSVALNSAARDISKYSYLYFKLGLDEMEAKLDEAASESKSIGSATLDGVAELMDAFSDTKEADDLESFKFGINDMKTAGNTLKDIGSSTAEKFADDPKAFMLGMGALAGQELVSEGKAKIIAQQMGGAFMKKNLMAFKGDTADAFLKRHGVEDGVNGLSFTGSSILHGGGDEILLVVTYDIKVIKLLNIDFSFKVKQTAKTKAWGNGTSNALPPPTESGS